MARREILAWTMLVLVALALVAPSFVGWHHDDDLQNMRWAIEYRDAPWRALTDRHALHDHIRPATLWATWAGAQISNGAWWGPHLVGVGLLLGAWLAMAVLVSELVESRVAGLLTAALILDLEGFRLLLDWNSWINTAGELCFGLLGLILVHRALGRGAAALSSSRSLAGAFICMLLAGLFKEPGWVVYPGVAALMALGAWRRGDSRRTPALVGSMVVVGALGFLWSHTSANVDRLGADLDVLSKLGELQHSVRPWADVWPADALSGRGWKGILLPVVGLALSSAIVLRRKESPSEAQGRAIILGTALLTGVCYVRPDWVGGVVGLGLVGMIWVHRSGLLAVLGVLTCGVMFLFPGPNPVQILPAAMAFAALVAVHSARLVRPSGPPALRLFAGIILAGGLGHQALQIANRLEAPDPSPRDAPGQITARDQLLAEGALFKALGVRMVFYSSELGSRALGPLLDFHVIPYNRELEPYSMQVSESLWVAMDGAVAQSVLVEPSLLDAHRAGGHPGALPLTLEPGFYAAGMTLVDSLALARLTIQTPCMGDVIVENSRSGTTWVVSAFRIVEGCGEVEVEASTGREGSVEQYFLSRLDAPEVDLRAADFHAPLLGLSPVEAMPEKH